MDVGVILEQYILNEVMFADRGKKLDPDQSLIMSGIIDSLELLRLISFIEERFGVRVEDEEVVPDNFETINVITSFIKSKSPS